MLCRNQDNEPLNKPFEHESDIPNLSGSKTLQFKEAESIGDDVSHDEFHGVDKVNAWDESESLSDIDDLEVDGYLHNDKERCYKKIIWEAMNREYLEEEAAKEAAAKGALNANFHDHHAVAVAKSRKERQQKRAAEAKKSHPAHSAAEITWQMLNKKRRSSKINYGVLDNLLEETEDPEDLKKARTGSPPDDEDRVQHVTEKEAELEDTHENDDQGLVDEYEYDGYNGGEYGDDNYDENAVEGYDYDNDDDGCY